MRPWLNNSSMLSKILASSVRLAQLELYRIYFCDSWLICTQTDIVNFGLSQEQVDRQFGIGKSLFELSTEEKLKYRADLENGGYNGYKPLGIRVRCFPSASGLKPHHTAADTASRKSGPVFSIIPRYTTSLSSSLLLIAHIPPSSMRTNPKSNTLLDTSTPISCSNS